jgi:hypothetical protein
MLRFIEFGLLAVSLLTVLALIIASPREAEVLPGEVVEPELQPKLPPAVNR